MCNVPSSLILLIFAVPTVNTLQAQSMSIADLLGYSTSINSAYDQSTSGQTDLDTFSTNMIAKGFLLTEFKNTVQRTAAGVVVSGDSHHVFTRLLPETNEGDIVTIDTTGLTHQSTRTISITLTTKNFSTYQDWFKSITAQGSGFVIANQHPPKLDKFIIGSKTLTIGPDITEGGGGDAQSSYESFVVKDPLIYSCTLKY